jgi:hypothetical protein
MSVCTKRKSQRFVIDCNLAEKNTEAASDFTVIYACKHVLKSAPRIMLIVHVEQTRGPNMDRDCQGEHCRTLNEVVRASRFNMLEACI